MDPSALRLNSTLPTNMSLSAHLRELAYVRRNPIEGRKPIFAHLTRPAGHSDNFDEFCYFSTLYLQAYEKNRQMK